MFLLKQGRTVVVLVTIFGILLPDLYIEPAQADAEVQAGIQAEAQPKAAAPPDPSKGLKCYHCEPCTSNTDLGTVKDCPQFFLCGLTEGWEKEPTKTRGCVSPRGDGSYDSCLNADPMDQNKDCACAEDLCNTFSFDIFHSSPPSSSSAQPPRFRISVTLLVFLFGSLMIMW